MNRAKRSDKELIVNILNNTTLELIKQNTV